MTNREIEKICQCGHSKEIHKLQPEGTGSCSAERGYCGCPYFRPAKESPPLESGIEGILKEFEAKFVNWTSPSTIGSGRTEMVEASKYLTVRKPEMIVSFLRTALEQVRKEAYEEGLQDAADPENKDDAQWRLGYVYGRKEAQKTTLDNCVAVVKKYGQNAPFNAAVATAVYEILCQLKSLEQK